MKIEVKGPIIDDSEQWIYDWFRIPATSPKKVNTVIEKAISSGVNELTIVINSPGGYVFSASEIWTELKKFSGNVKGEIVGVAASAASVIAMACSELTMSPTATLMIHNASTGARGDYRVMDDTSDLLQKVNQTILSTYERRTGKSKEELEDLMNKETWMTAQEALDLGFIDSIMFANELPVTANASIADTEIGMLPKNVIETMRKLLASDNKFNFATQIEPTNITGKEEDKTMDIEKLKNDHPDLYEQIRNIGYQEGVQAERKRIKDIMDIATAGAEDIIEAAMFETGISASETAMRILKNQKDKQAGVVASIKNDAVVLDQVEVTATNAVDDKEKNIDNFVDSVFKNMNGGK